MSVVHSCFFVCAYMWIVMCQFERMRETGFFRVRSCKLCFSSFVRSRFLKRLCLWSFGSCVVVRLISAWCLYAFGYWLRERVVWQFSLSSCFLYFVVSNVHMHQTSSLHPFFCRRLFRTLCCLRAQGDVCVSCCEIWMVAEPGLIGNDSMYPSSLKTCRCRWMMFVRLLGKRSRNSL